MLIGKLAQVVSTLAALGTERLISGAGLQRCRGTLALAQQVKVRVAVYNFVFTFVFLAGAWLPCLASLTKTSGPPYSYTAG